MNIKWSECGQKSWKQSKIMENTYFPIRKMNKFWSETIKQIKNLWKSIIFNRNIHVFIVFLGKQLKVCWKFGANFQWNFHPGMSNFQWNFHPGMSNFQCKVSPWNVKLSMQTFNECLLNNIYSLKLTRKTFYIESLHWKFDIPEWNFHWKFDIPGWKFHWKFDIPGWKFHWKFAPNFQQTFNCLPKNTIKICIFLLKIMDFQRFFDLFNVFWPEFVHFSTGKVWVFQYFWPIFGHV